MKKLGRIMLIFSICLLLFCNSAIANDSIFGHFLADAHRINTQSDIAVVFEDDIIDSKSGQASTITNIELLGYQLYELIDVFVNSEKQFYISGADIDVEASIGGVNKKSTIKKISILSKAYLPDDKYILSLSVGAKEIFLSADITDKETIMIIKEYSSKDNLLYEYANSIETYEEQTQDTDKINTPENEGQTILKKQTPTLILSLVLLGVVIIIYLVIKKKLSAKD